MDEYLSDAEQVERLRQVVARERLVLDRRCGDRLAGALWLQPVFRVSGSASRKPRPRCMPPSRRRPTATIRRRGNRFAALRSEYPDHAYTHQAALARGQRRGRHVSRQPPPRSCASRWSRATTPSSRWWRVFGSRACSRIASQHQEALALLNVPEPGQFAGRIAEIKGDIHVALGETDAARTAYLEAMVAAGRRAARPRVPANEARGLARRCARAGIRRDAPPEARHAPARAGRRPRSGRGPRGTAPAAPGQSGEGA